MTMSPTPCPRRDERGTSLILALVFVFAIGMVLVAVGGLAANALLNTSNARAERTSPARRRDGRDDRHAVSPLQPRSHSRLGASCLPPNSTIPSSDPTTEQRPIRCRSYCTLSVDPDPARTRIVEFYACSSGITSPATCETTGPMLHAEVAYNDLNSQGIDDCYAAEPVAVTTSCGRG